MAMPQTGIARGGFGGKASRTTPSPRKTPKGHAPAGDPKPTKKTPPRPYSGYLSPAEVNAQAMAQAKKILDAAISPLMAQSARIGPQYLAAGEGLAQALAPLSGQIRELYANNAASQSSLASGYSQAVQGVLNANSQAQAGSLAQLGMPGLGSNLASQTGDVIYGTGGSLPAQTMGTTGTGFAAAAAFAPGAARTQARADLATARQKYADQVAELRAKQPEVFQSLLESGRSWQDTLFDNNIQGRAQNLYENKYLLDAAASAGLDANGNLQPGYTLAPDGHTVIPPGYSYNTKTGAVTKTSTAKASTAKTPAERKAETRATAIAKRNDETADAIVDLSTWLQKQLATKDKVTIGKGTPISAGKRVDRISGKSIPLYRLKGGGVTDDANHPNVATTNRTEERNRKVNYKVARDYIRGQLRARLARFGWSQKQINEMAARILHEQRINPPKGKPKPERNRAAEAKPRRG